ncbi:MAG: radical SAM protein [Chloroflexota bacterium]|nr:radical SAM protein [Chloroflexota bacterium]
MMLPLARDPAAEARVVRSRVGSHLFVVDGSRLYDVEPHVADRVAAALAAKGAVPAPEERGLLATLGLFSGPAQARFIDGQPLDPPPLYSLSLNVAQACNMVCGYCYADEGRFGGRPRLMGLDVARASVDRLIAESSPGADLVLGFMGGEPLVHRAVVHETTRYAARAARAAGRRIRFAMTTNATLIQPADAELFAELPFALAVSIDGKREQHDVSRPMKDGSSGYDRLLAGLAVLERHGRPRHLSARVTVTPLTGDLLPILDHVLGLGFDEVGFAAVLVSVDPSLAFGPAQFPRFLERMIACGEKALGEIAAGRAYPFGNFETALQQIHRGTHRPYPCGAGAAYLSANAEGRLFACHRLIDDPAYAMGTVHGGTDLAARREHLARSHVDLMEPCRGCWARYLCGGGCYHEVSRRGRVGCDYIQGWLEFCLRAYAELSTTRPEYFTMPAKYFAESVSSPTTLAQ